MRRKWQGLQAHTLPGLAAQGQADVKALLRSPGPVAPSERERITGTYARTPKAVLLPCRQFEGQNGGVGTSPNTSSHKVRSLNEEQQQEQYQW